MVTKNNYELKRDKYYNRKSRVGFLKHVLKNIKYIVRIGLILVAPPFIFAFIFEDKEVIQLCCLAYYLISLAIGGAYIDSH